MAERARPAGGAALPLTPLPRHGSSRFVAKTLSDLAHGLEATLSAEATARLPGFAQRLDPRGKVIWFLVLLLAASFARHIVTLGVLCLLAHALAVATRLPLGRFARRVWTFIPFFAFVIALPAVLNVITPGRLLVELVNLGAPFSWWIFALPQHVGISEQGLRAAVTLVLRVATSVALAVLLVSTTRWATLLQALETLRLPRTLVLVLSMAYRYLILLLRSANAMFLARESRRVGALPAAEQRRWLAGAGGALLGKSYHLSNEVYLAMLSRGFRGEVRLAERFTWRRRDWLAGLCVCAVALGALLLDSVQ